MALDPEWKLTATQRPLKQIGTSAAQPINNVSSYLANLTLKNRLPEKIFMVHQFKSYQLPDRDRIVDRPGLATVLHVDGFGAQGSKKETYGILHSRDPPVRQRVQAVLRRGHEPDDAGRGDGRHPPAGAHHLPVAPS